MQPHQQQIPFQTYFVSNTAILSLQHKLDTILGSLGFDLANLFEIKIDIIIQLYKYAKLTATSKLKQDIPQLLPQITSDADKQTCRRVWTAQLDHCSKYFDLDDNLSPNEPSKYAYRQSVERFEQFIQKNLQEFNNLQVRTSRLYFFVNEDGSANTEEMKRFQARFYNVQNLDFSAQEAGVTPMSLNSYIYDVLQAAIEVYRLEAIIQVCIRNRCSFNEASLQVSDSGVWSNFLFSTQAASRLTLWHFGAIINHIYTSAQNREDYLKLFNQLNPQTGKPNSSEQYATLLTALRVSWFTDKSRADGSIFKNVGIWPPTFFYYPNMTNNNTTLINKDLEAAGLFSTYPFTSVHDLRFSEKPEAIRLLSPTQKKAWDTMISLFDGPLNTFYTVRKEKFEDLKTHNENILKKPIDPITKTKTESHVSAAINILAKISDSRTEIVEFSKDPNINFYPQRPFTVTVASEYKLALSEREKEISQASKRKQDNSNATNIELPTITGTLDLDFSKFGYGAEPDTPHMDVVPQTTSDMPDLLLQPQNSQQQITEPQEKPTGSTSTPAPSSPAKNDVLVIDDDVTTNVSSKSIDDDHTTPDMAVSSQTDAVDEDQKLAQQFADNYKNNSTNKKASSKKKADTKKKSNTKNKTTSKKTTTSRKRASSDANGGDEELTNSEKKSDKNKPLKSALKKSNTNKKRKREVTFDPSVNDQDADDDDLSDGDYMEENSEKQSTASPSSAKSTTSTNGSKEPPKKRSKKNIQHEVNNNNNQVDQILPDNSETVKPIVTSTKSKSNVPAVHGMMADTYPEIAVDPAYGLEFVLKAEDISKPDRLVDIISTLSDTLTNNERLKFWVSFQALVASQTVKNLFNNNSN